MLRYETVQIKASKDFDLKKAANTWGGAYPSSVPFQVHVAAEMIKSYKDEILSIENQLQSALWKTVEKIEGRAPTKREKKKHWKVENKTLSWKGVPVIRNITISSFELLIP